MRISMLHEDKHAGRRILLSGVILGLDPRICIRAYSAELSRIPGATDARVEPEHDAESSDSNPMRRLILTLMRRIRPL
jgi:hypothetical protein